MIVENHVIYFMIKMYSTICTSVIFYCECLLSWKPFLGWEPSILPPPECAGKFALQLRHRWSNVGVTAQACWLV